jgi:hypothetical protein
VSNTSSAEIGIVAKENLKERSVYNEGTLDQCVSNKWHRKNFLLPLLF